MDSVQIKPLQKDLKYFYENILVEGFPNKDELDKFEDLIDYKLQQNKKHSFNMWGIYYNDVLAGGVIFDYYKDSKDILIEYISVSSVYRNKGLASLLVNKIINEFKSNYIIIEVENPRINPTIENITREKFWRKLGFKKLDFNYIQPAISEDKKEVSSLMIMCLVNNIKLSKEKIKFKRLNKILKNYFVYSMKIKNKSYIEKVLTFKNKYVVIENKGEH